MIDTINNGESLSSVRVKLNTLITSVNGATKDLVSSTVLTSAQNPYAADSAMQFTYKPYTSYQYTFDTSGLGGEVWVGSFTTYDTPSSGRIATVTPMVFGMFVIIMDSNGLLTIFSPDVDMTVTPLIIHEVL